MQRHEAAFSVYDAKCTNLDTTWEWLIKRHTIIARLSCLIGLLAAAALCGAGAYYVVSNQETVLAETQYYAVTESAIDNVNHDLSRKVFVLQAFAGSYSGQFPDLEMWPNVALNGFSEIAEYTRFAASDFDTAITFTPLVTLENQVEFEAFAAEYIADTYPEGVGRTSNGSIAIWNLDRTNLVDRIRDDDGATLYGSSYAGLLFPLLQVSAEQGTGAWQSRPFYREVMRNEHNFPARGRPMDRIMECVSEATSGESEFDDLNTCNSVTISRSDTAPYGEMVIEFTQPIFPANNRTTVVGMSAMMVSLVEIVSNIVPGFVTGLDIVLEGSDGYAVTYAIKDGRAKFVAEEDKHDSKYDKYRQQSDLTGTNLLGASPAYYTISVYPTEEFFEYYQTDEPWRFTGYAVGIIGLASVIFAIYDYSMRRESSQKSIVLEAKRAFVRYISHEIRTPLNTVYLGLRVLEDGLTKRLSILQKTADSLFVKSVEGSSTALPSYSSLTYSAGAAEPFTTLPGEIDDEAKSTGSHDDSAASSDVCSDVTEWLDLSQDLIQNVRSAVDVLTAILNYDKVTSGTLSLDVSLTPVWQMIKTTVDAFMIQAQQKNITLLLRMEPDARPWSAAENNEARAQWINALLLLGDEVHLVQVVRNLVSNALKFTPAGGSITVNGHWEERGTQPMQHTLLEPDRAQSTSQYLGHICSSVSSSFSSTEGDLATATPAASTIPFSPVNCDAADARPIPKTDIVKSGLLRLTVIDTGAGLSKSQLAEMFQEGVQFSRNRLQAGGGSGLGLSISKGIVKQHGGALTVDSPGLGQGCTFTLRLPLYHSNQVTAASCSSALDPGNNSGDHVDAANSYNRLTSPSSAIPAIQCATHAAHESVQLPDRVPPHPPSYPPPPPPYPPPNHLDDNGGDDVQPHVAVGLTPVASEPASAGVGSPAVLPDVGSDNSVAKNPKSLTASATASSASAEHQHSVPLRSTASPLAGANGNADVSIFVVDDAALNRKMLIRLLKTKGHKRFIEAVDGVEALEKYQQVVDAGETVDLILMDYEMPKMNGPSCTKELRLLGCRVPIIGVTGNVMPADKELFIRHGANAVMGKPLEYALLQDAFRSSQQRPWRPIAGTELEARLNAT